MTQHEKIALGIGAAVIAIVIFLRLRSNNSTDPNAPEGTLITGSPLDSSGSASSPDTSDFTIPVFQVPTAIPSNATVPAGGDSSFTVPTTVGANLNTPLYSPAPTQAQMDAANAAFASKSSPVLSTPVLTTSPVSIGPTVVQAPTADFAGAIISGLPTAAPTGNIFVPVQNIPLLNIPGPVSPVTPAEPTRVQAPMIAPQTSRPAAPLPNFNAYPYIPLPSIDSFGAAANRAANNPNTATVATPAPSTTIKPFAPPVRSTP